MISFSQARRDPWRVAWAIATGDALLTILLLAAAAALLVAVWLPQEPAGDPVTYAQWLTQAQNRFGSAMPTVEALGLFGVMQSPGFRALLFLLASCLLLRSIDGAETLLQAERRPWASLFPLLAHAGGVLVLASLLVTHLWGWRSEGQIVQAGQRTPLGEGRWVALAEDGSAVSHSPGIETFVEAWGPGVRAGVTDARGQSLQLLQTTTSEPSAELTLPLTEDRYFAVPDADLIVRLAPQFPIRAGSPVRVQVYRSPPGQLVTETVMAGDTELTVDGTTVALENRPFAQVTATFNPGRWPAGVSLVLLMVGLVGCVAWPACWPSMQGKEGQSGGVDEVPPDQLGSGED